MKDYELERVRKWGYSPRICYAKAMGVKCVSPKITCNVCEFGNKSPHRFEKLKKLVQANKTK